MLNCRKVGKFTECQYAPSYKRWSLVATKTFENRLRFNFYLLLARRLKLVILKKVLCVHIDLHLFVISDAVNVDTYILVREIAEKYKCPNELFIET